MKSWSENLTEDNCNTKISNSLKKVESFSLYLKTSISDFPNNFARSHHTCRQFSNCHIMSKEGVNIQLSTNTATRHGSRGGAPAGPGPPPSSAKKKKRGERERKEKKKKRGKRKRKRDIKKLRCHNLFFCAYIGLHWPMGGQEASAPINEGEI